MKYTKLNLKNPALAAAFIAATGLTSFTASANGGHFLVDDATLTPPGSCQLESWIQRADSESVLTLQPACSIDAGWEIAVPLEYNTNNSELETWGFEAKTILTDDFLDGALAITLGVARDQLESDWAGGFINLPYSRYVQGFGTLHVNVGVEYDQFAESWNSTWGVATTTALGAASELILEVAGVSDADPIVAAGIRVPGGDNWELDVSVGRDLDADSNLVTVGFNIAF